MLRNYLKIAFRSLWKNKAFSFINIVGLATGLAVCILIMLWVNNELSYNNFHKNGDRIAAVMVNRTSNAEVATFPACPSLLAGAMKKELPAIEYAARVSWGDVRLINRTDQYFSEYGLYVDAEFLKIFSFPLIKGNINNVLQEPHTILINEDLAKKYFGEEDAIGKSIWLDKTEQYKVQGVFKNVPGNSTLRFSFLAPFRDYLQSSMGGKENWTNNNIKTYVKLRPGTNDAQLNARLKHFMQQHTTEQVNTSVFLWKMKDWYLRYDFKNGRYAGGGRIAYVNLFIIIAIFILLLACINFMNLSTARATQRAKEVGIRKVTGAARITLILQFIGESVLLAAIAGSVAIALVTLALPAFNSLLNKHIVLDYNNISQLAVFIAVIVFTGILAGSYPSFVLSSFKPVVVLKSGKAHSGGGASWVRKGLVVTQFAVSVMLIIGTLVVYRQVKYVQQKNLGYNKENLLWFPNNIDKEKMETAVSEFGKVEGVVSVGRASTTFTSPTNRSANISWANKKPGDDIFFTFITGDHNLTQTMGITIKEGRAFSRSYSTDTGAYLLNEEAVKRMGLVNPVGQTIETYTGKGTIVGVVNDFHTESLHNPITPVIIECRPEWTWLYYVRISNVNPQKTIAGLERIYKQLAPGYPMDYSFQDKEYESLYRSETQMGTLANWFAFFAIFISCLGLLGLTLFTVERKTKEIGIRKVLGASVLSVVSLLSKQFLLLILLAIVIAVAPAWYFMNQWLQNYTYRTALGWQVFVLAGGIALVVAIVTISVLSVKAAMANPVKSLRSE